MAYFAEFVFQTCGLNAAPSKGVYQKAKLKRGCQRCYVAIVCLLQMTNLLVRIVIFRSPLAINNCIVKRFFSQSVLGSRRSLYATGVSATDHSKSMPAYVSILQKFFLAVRRSVEGVRIQIFTT